MSELHIDPRMPPVDHCVLRPLLERQAAAQPDKVYAWFDTGEEWTYRQMRQQAVRTANALRALGVKRGDRVICWLPSGPDILRLWFGLNYLGAVYVPINLAYRGQLLEHVVNNSDAELIVAHASLVERLHDVKCPRLKRAIVFSGKPAAVPGLELLPAEAASSTDDSLPALDAPIAPWDVQSIIYTSGTTGPSKGVLSSYMQLYSMSMPPKYYGADDRFVINLPYFHAGGTMPTYSMLIRGGSIAVVENFKTDKFWEEIKRSQATTLILLGSMATFIARQPERPDERNHNLRSALVVPFNDMALKVRERFGIEVHTHFNMTEISQPILSEANPTLVGVAGKARPGVEVRLVDENDCEVAVGMPGELIVRSDCPWALNSGYNNEPKATATAWRNGWFHTGDAFKRDAEGNYFFLDRMKDAIRRRGENISSFEVEAVVTGHPAVKEAAVVAYPSEVGEEEVVAVLTLREGATLDPAELIQYCVPRMAHFMVPRYVWVVDELPRTPTQ
ncbi:MAG: AMP-binding protein, partial [Nevskia sp.]|nr:AMP-binding protein [Nevskia sp.]